MHKLGTAMASVGATLVATAIYAAAGAESPVANMDATYHDTTRVVVDSSTQITYKPAEPQWMKSEQKGTKLVPRAEAQELRNFSWMSDVAGAGSPTILNPQGLSTFVVGIKHSQEQGWTVTSVESKGSSSDEWQTSPDAGLGELDAGNKRVAEQYVKTGDQQLKKEMTEDGVALPDATFTSSSQEVVIDGSLRTFFDEQVGELGFASAAEFIKAYKANPNGLGPKAHEIAAAFLENNRGTWHIARMTRTILVETPAYEETTATRCVDERVTRLITQDRVTEYGGNLPVFPVLFPVIRRRRKDDFLSEWNGESVAQAAGTQAEGEGEKAQPFIVDGEVVPANEVKTRADGSKYIEGSLPVWASYVGKIRRHRQPQPPREAQPRHEESLAKPPKQIWEMNHSELSAYFAAKRRAEIRGAAIFGISAAAVLSCLRLDAGYCPDPQNWQNQDWSITHPFPDSIHAGLGLPFFIPGPETSKIEILPPVCPEEDRGEPYSDGGNGSNGKSGNGGTSDPTCDTKQVTIVNGKVTKLSETHYPGAITVKTTER